MKCKCLKNFLRSVRGVSALEYAILVGVVVVAIATALGVFTTEIENALTNAGKSLSGVPGLSP